MRERHPIATLKVGDVIIGPFGRYELRVTEIDAPYVRGVYTKVPPEGYANYQHCCYLKSDWQPDGFVFASSLDQAAKGGE